MLDENGNEITKYDPVLKDSLDAEITKDWGSDTERYAYNYDESDPEKVRYYT